MNPLQLLEELPDPLVAADAQHRITFVNRGAELLLAWPARDLVGQALEVLTPPRFRDAKPFWRRLPWGTPVRAPVLRRDGAEIEVELMLGESAAGLVGLLRRRLEDVPTAEPLLTGPAPQAEQYRLVFENAPVGIIHYDARGIVTGLNDTMLSILGSTRQLAAGLDMRTLQGSPGRNAIAALVAGTLQGKAGRFEGEYVSQMTGRVLQASAVFAPIFAARGEVLGGVGIVLDVSERKRIEAALSQKDRMASIGTLAAGVAHEINNPLVYVTLGLELIERELVRLQRVERVSAEEWERVLVWSRDALQGAERVRAIVRDLRAFSRADEEQPVRLELQRVLDSAMNMAMSHIRPRAQIVREYGPCPAVLAPEGRLAQVFLNLMINAAQAIPEGAPEAQRITVRTRTGERGEAVAEVDDTGVGIPAAKLPHIFEPFWTDKPLGVGTGLGLSICHGIVSGLGGEIAVQSTPGKGSCFRVSLPAHLASATPPSVQPIPRPPSPGPLPRVLLIDDEPHLGVTLRTGLRQSAQVTSVQSGREAVALLSRDQSFDLILCDLMMPDLTGMDVYEQIRSAQPALAARFVFTTGGAVTERAHKFLEEKGRRRLDKPFKLEQVELLLPRR